MEVSERNAEQALKLQIKSAQLTYKIIEHAIIEYLEASAKASTMREMKIDKFKKTDGAKEILPVSMIDVDGIRNELKKEKIGFAFEKVEDTKYELYYKSQDISQVKKAMEKHTQKEIAMGASKKDVESKSEPKSREMDKKEGGVVKQVKASLKKEGIGFMAIKNKVGEYSLYFKGKDIDTIKKNIKNFKGREKKETIEHRLEKAVDVAAKKNEKLKEKNKPVPDRRINDR